MAGIIQNLEKHKNFEDIPSSSKWTGIPKGEKALKSRWKKSKIITENSITITDTKLYTYICIYTYIQKTISGKIILKTSTGAFSKDRCWETMIALYKKEFDWLFPLVPGRGNSNLGIYPK